MKCHHTHTLIQRTENIYSSELTGLLGIFLLERAVQEPQMYVVLEVLLRIAFLIPNILGALSVRYYYVCLAAINTFILSTY